MSLEKIKLIEKRLAKKGIAEYEIFFIENKVFETQFLKKEMDTKRNVTEDQYVLRILSQQDDKTGIGILNSNTLDEKSIDKNIERCVKLSKTNISSKYRFPKPQTTSNIQVADENILTDPEGILEDHSEELKSQIDSLDETTPTFGRFRTHIEDIYITNSNDVNLNAKKTYFYIEFAIKSHEDNNLAEYWDAGYVKERSHLKFDERVQRWARIAKDALKAKSPKPSTEATVIFSPGLLRAALNPVIAHHASSQAYHEKTSQFKIDDQVGSEKITILENALLEGGLKSRPWDGEGTPHRINEVIKGGKFKTRLYDQRYAIMDDTESTGNGIRIQNGSITNGISNLEILPGDISYEEMISNINDGYYIERCSWLNPQPLTGAFGSEIRIGYYIKNGEIQHPIKGGNISGSSLEMLNNCKYISKKREFSENSLFPYIAFDNLTISF
ncbi:MAG: putative Peptidase U62 modulator of DNA gyrase [Promethearchaeota archaeon]|nr:MAG: putative Peptidase U62 modulator of DNA gyrase [Candidatus Lokiarchaeota archaeon]